MKKGLLLSIASLSLLMTLTGCTGMRPKDLGIKNGKLKACPSIPNCVSTQSDDPEHKMDPLTYMTSEEAAMKKLVSIVNSLERTRIITRTDDYLYVEFTSRIMRYVDDVEFYIDDSKKLIHFRSASRLGYSDMGVNRKRMEEITRLFNQ